MIDFLKIFTKSKKKVKDLAPYLLFFENHLYIIFHPTNDVNSFIVQSKKYTDSLEMKDTNKIKLIDELWMLRYASLFNWFINLIPPSNQEDLEDTLILLESATKQVLNKIDKINYLTTLKSGLIKYQINQLTYNNLKQFNSRFAQCIAEKIPLIAFECTEGMLGGEQYEGVISLISLIIETDKKTFSLGEKTPLTDQERATLEREIKLASLNKKDITEVWNETLNSLN